jgi:hypothetical protein
LINPILNKAPSHFLPLSQRTPAPSQVTTNDSDNESSSSDSDSDSDSDSGSSSSSSEEEVNKEMQGVNTIATPIVKTPAEPRHSMMSGVVKNITRRKPPAKNPKFDATPATKLSLAEVIRNSTAISQPEPIEEVSTANAINATPTDKTANNNAVVPDINSTTTVKKAPAARKRAAPAATKKAPATNAAAKRAKKT